MRQEFGTQHCVYTRLGFGTGSARPLLLSVAARPTCSLTRHPDHRPQTIMFKIVSRWAGQVVNALWCVALMALKLPAQRSVPN
jgi:hypothetical protein